ncbi:putative nf-x1-type zinc finger protein nfxl1 [Phaeomoniella chlamydospora]|uniref:Putative nf-x1-type zinc finger protein nfxl1 n=1 Tax=Phaeomoniella chlamydospora TaxID=158046 RepID=A0A0G2DWE7_PHACM|nr:putative nf-x1-type zinc finger protein nfxl1 [Phaeomoniella chlamydospora]
MPLRLAKKTKLALLRSLSHVTARGGKKRTSPIKCDDECARLVRNAQLAQALNIPDGHSDDHVPYASTTLSLYSDLETAWTHAQETTLRIFAADETEKRLRFKPMKTGQRAFIHSLAEDFGIDSESVDPEPHRHVVLFKTPKFVSAPMKTLAQAARIRRTQAVTRASAMAENEGTATKRADEAHPPLNGYLLIKPRFALTIDEVTSHIQQVVSLPFHVHFMTQRDAIALIPLPSSSERQLQQQLLKLRPSVAAEISKYQIAESVLLCALDPSAAANPRSDTSDPPILYEQDPDLAELVTIGLSSAAGGWSQVAAKSSASSRRPVPQQKSVGERPVYTVLGSKLAAHKKRKEEEERIARENEQFEKKIAEQGVGENWEDEIVDDEDEEEKVD